MLFLSAVSNDVMNAICSTDICVYNHKSYHVGVHNADKFNNRVEWLVYQKNRPIQERYEHEKCLAIARSGNRKLYEEERC